MPIKQNELCLLEVVWFKARERDSQGERHVRSMVLDIFRFAGILLFNFPHIFLKK